MKPSIADRADVAPSGLLQAGGRIDRFGMPVDPGNLLFTGQLAGRPVVGLPGCARSPALNGADWVLERLVAGLDVPGPEIAAMGVGGLLKEIPQRAQPRRAPRRKGAQLEIVLLAAGAARRMRGQDKLLRPVSSQVPLLAHSARAAVAAGLGKVHVVVPLGNEARKSALEGIPVNVVETAAWQLGMAHSLRAGLAEVSAQAAGAIVALADMPDVGAAHFKALAAAFNPEGGAEIRRSVTATGAAGHPVLFSRRFFESLADLDGDRGARDILKSSPEMVVDVSTPGEGAVVDLDTPEAWAAWETRQPGA